MANTAKYSKQRELILNILRSSKSHPTADEVYEQARLQIPKISLGTVYRNLNFLAAEGRIQRLGFDSGIAQFDGDLRDHYHIRCTRCGRIEDVPHGTHRVTYDEVESLTGYKIHHLHLAFFGLCRECKQKREEEP
ncbi:transcriptional repressor [bacterium]|nr:transcriptional repressor [bacterium]